MSRAWRIEYEGALYYLLSRGNERSDIFINDKKLKKRYAGVKPDSALPQQRQIGIGFVSNNYLRKGEQIFECDVEAFVKENRGSKLE